MSRSPLVFAALPLAVALAYPALAAATEEADTIVVTASRFDEAEATAVGNLIVLTAKDIARLPASNLPALLSTVAGVDVRSFYGNQGADTQIDLRGFGENSQLRTLVLVDGRRVEQLDFSTPNWNSVPLEAIERIEIARGSSTVLYGDQAVGGVINIITRRGRSDQLRASVTAGSFGYRQIKGSMTRAGTTALSLDAEHAYSDEYRHNNAYRNSAVHGRVARQLDAGEVFADFGAGKTHFGLPGALTEAQFVSDPRSAETIDSFFDRDSWRLRPGIALQLSPVTDLQAELSVEDNASRSWVSNWASYRNVDTRAILLTPRLRFLHQIGPYSATTVVGADLNRATLNQTRHSHPEGPATGSTELERNGLAVYLHNVTHLTSAVSINSGARSQRFRQNLRDSADGTREDRDHETAYELGATWQTSPTQRLFAKASTTFRFPVLDEYTTFTGLASPLPRPETGKGIDIGGKWQGDAWRLQATAYRLQMEDEIVFNNATLQNDNLQATEHRGVELAASLRVSSGLRFDASANRKSAEFRTGVNAGKTIPLVPRTTATLGATAEGGVWGQHTLLARYLGRRHFGGDNANAFAPLPATTTIDWQSSLQRGPWTMALRVLNLTDRKYATTGFNYGFGSSYYIANPRTAYLSATLTY